MQSLLVGPCSTLGFRFGLDKQLFLLKLSEPDLRGITQFYSLVVDAWQRSQGVLTHNFLSNTTFSSGMLRTKFVEGSIVKLGHPRRTSAETTFRITNIKSIRVLGRFVEEVWQSLSVPFRTIDQNPAPADQWNDDNEYVFPSLYVSPAVCEWGEDTGLLLSLTTPELGSFSSCGEKYVYYSCVKVLNYHSLTNVTQRPNPEYAVDNG